MYYHKLFESYGNLRCTMTEVESQFDNYLLHLCYVVQRLFDSSSEVYILTQPLIDRKKENKFTITIIIMVK